jgi:hypothetical protein
VDEERPDSTRKSRSKPALRQVVAIIVIALAATLVILSNLASWPRVCADAVATVGPNAVVRTCSPIGLPALIPVAVLVVALLWPDLSEVAIPGLVTLRRTIEEQAQRQSVLEHRILQIQNSQTAQQQVTVLMTTEHLQRLPEEAKEKAPLLEGNGRLTQRDIGLTPGAGRSGPPAGATVAELGMMVLTVWEELARVLAAIDDPRGHGMRAASDRFTDEQLRLIERWRDLYDQEINVVQAARNAVAQGGQPSLSASDLQQVIRTGKELLRVLWTRLPTDSSAEPSSSGRAG